MKREEAIEVIKEVRFDINTKINGTTRFSQALEMAIKALEQEPCEDAISRQEVLDLVADYDLNMGQVVKGIYALPSVTLQLSSELEKNSQKLAKDFGELDCISRADLYNRIKKIDHDEDYECDEFGGSKITYHTCDWDEVLREIEDAPSVTPQEPKTGHWIRISPAMIYECSECGHNVMTSDICAYKFCHGCGIKMVEPQESEEV